jgi:hypothetical protein
MLGVDKEPNAYVFLSSVAKMGMCSNFLQESLFADFTHIQKLAILPTQIYLFNFIIIIILDLLARNFWKIEPCSSLSGFMKVVPLRNQMFVLHMMCRI